MAVTATTSDFELKIVGSARGTRSGTTRHRRISPEAGRALEILGHAIEYLTDEYIYRGGSFAAGDGELEAIHTLMGINRQIYFECPEVPSMASRWRSLLHLSPA